MKDEQKQKLRKTAQETKPHTKKKNASNKIVIKKRLP
jgi:hypothetical protein